MTPTTLIGVIIALCVARAILYLFPKIGIPANHKRTMVEYLDSIIVAGVTALLLINFVVRSFYIPSQSMEHTLEVNDYILVNEFVYHFYHPGRGDIVVFKPPPAAEAGDKDYIKRVVAVEGETLEVRDEKVYINGQPLNEPYKTLSSGSAMVGREFGPVTIKSGNVFCMGDNRHNSQDSRFWGQLPVENIIGKAAFIFFPPRRIRMLH